MKVDVRGKIMFTEKCCRDVRGFYLIQTHSTHWYILNDKGHCSLLDTFPKVPLINKEHLLHVSLPSTAPEVLWPAKLTEEKGWMDRALMLCLVWRVVGALRLAFLAGWWSQALFRVPTAPKGSTAREIPTNGFICPKKDSLPDSATPIHLQEPVTQLRGVTLAVEFGCPLSLLSEKQSVFW